MDNVISIVHLHKSYRALKAVNDLSFSVDSGTCFAILGPNGAGKTTAIKTIYGKTRVDACADTRMSIFGYDPRKQELNIKMLTGVVQQDNNLDYELNVEQNLFIYARFYGMDKRSASTRIDELLQFMELQDRRRAQLRTLSGGMKRRLIIARALINNPKLLILDEPTTGLDIQVRDLIWDRLTKLKKSGVTILLTTHYMDEARELSDHIMIMHKGRNILEGAPHRLMKEGIEPFVLAVTDMHAVKKPKEQRNIRALQAGDRGFFYATTAEELQKYAELLSTKNYGIRATNLEDIFMKATGGTLGEQQ